MPHPGFAFKECNKAPRRLCQSGGLHLHVVKLNVGAGFQRNGVGFVSLYEVIPVQVA